MLINCSSLVLKFNDKDTSTVYLHLFLRLFQK